ncbi:hypothetical protein MMC22_009630 [Lobaria immixta]|nr:hypothetical protein [Lobaria immixta]
MSLTTFCFVSFLASTFPAVLCAPQTSGQIPSAISNNDGFFNGAEDGGTLLKLVAPSSNIVALQGDGLETSYTTDKILRSPSEDGNLEVPAPLLAQALPNLIPNTPSEYAAELRANPKPRFDEDECLDGTYGACCNPAKNSRRQVSAPQLECYWTDGRTNLPCQYYACCRSTLDGIPDGDCPNLSRVPGTLGDKIQDFKTFVNDIPGFGGGRIRGGGGTGGGGGGIGVWGPAGSD